MHVRWLVVECVADAAHRVNIAESEKKCCTCFINFYVHTVRTCYVLLFTCALFLI